MESNHVLLHVEQSYYPTYSHSVEVDSQGFEPCTLVCGTSVFPIITNRPFLLMTSASLSYAIEGSHREHQQ